MGGGGSGCPGSAGRRFWALPIAGMWTRKVGPSFLPDDVSRLDGRVSERRITRAYSSGRSDALLRDGLCQYTDRISLLLEPKLYIVLRAFDGSGPWTAVGKGQYLAACVGSPSLFPAIFRGFVTEDEGRAYAVGAGLSNDLPPFWTE